MQPNSDFELQHQLDGEITLTLVTSNDCGHSTQGVTVEKIILPHNRSGNKIVYWKLNFCTQKKKSCCI